MGGKNRGRNGIAICMLAALLGAVSCGRGGDDGGAVDPAARENVDAMSREHAGDNGKPGPGASLEPGRAVISASAPIPIKARGTDSQLMIRNRSST
jgi:hypothetical protein